MGRISDHRSLMGTNHEFHWSDRHVARIQRATSTLTLTPKHVKEERYTTKPHDHPSFKKAYKPRPIIISFPTKTLLNPTYTKCLHNEPLPDPLLTLSLLIHLLPR